MIINKAVDHRKKINRAIYELLALITCSFFVFFVTLEFQSGNVDRLKNKSNNFHLAISEKCLRMIGTFYKVRLRFLTHDLAIQKENIAPKQNGYTSPINMSTSKSNQLESLSHEIDRFVENINVAHTEFVDDEYSELVSILNRSQKKFHSALQSANIDESYSYQDFEYLVSLLIPTSLQLYYLHNGSYQDSNLLIAKTSDANQNRLIGLAAFLAIVIIIGIGRMLRHVRYTLLDLTTAQKNLQSQAKIIDQIHDSVISTDLEGNMLSWNNGSELLFGYKKEDIEGKHVSILYPEEEHELLENETIPSLKKIGSYDSNAKLMRKSGDIFHAHISLSMIYDDTGNSVGMIGYTMDVSKRVQAENELHELNSSLEKRIKERTKTLEESLLLIKNENTHRKQAETSFRVAKEHAEKANAAKSEFLSQMSHELRTPMNAILGFGQLLELDSEELTECQQNNIQDILDAGRHLLDIINKLLDLTKIESGQFYVSMEKVEVDTLLQQCLSIIQPEIRSHNLTLIDNISGNNYCVEADPTGFKEVVLNLLSNAVKYNRKHGRIILESKITKGKRLRICIMDDGKGLTNNDISKLFISFERLDKSNNTEGVGIGLVISKDLMELMGGSIGVDSAVGEGSVFWVEFVLVE